MRIAREMHDGMAQILAYVNTKAQAVQAHLARGRHEEAARQLDQLADAAREVYTEVREGINALRTELGPGLDFRQVLEKYIERWQSQSGIDGRLERRGRAAAAGHGRAAAAAHPPGGAGQRPQALRRAQRSTSRLRQHDGRVFAEVVDDGAGFDPAALKRSDFPRFGLAIMRERAESIGGRLEVGSRARRRHSGYNRDSSATPEATSCEF